MNPWPRLYDVRHIWWISPVKVPTVLGNDPEDWFLADTGVKQLEESVQSSFASTNHNIPEMFLETNFMGLTKKEVDPIKVSLNKSSNSHLAQGFEILERPLIGTMLTPSCLVWYWMNNSDEHEQWWNSPQLWSLVWWWKEPSSPSLLRRPSFSSQSPDERISTLVRDSREQNTSKHLHMTDREWDNNANWCEIVSPLSVGQTNHFHFLCWETKREISLNTCISLPACVSDTTLPLPL